MKILEGFSKDGTHPDYPVQKAFDLEEMSQKGGSHLLIDLPALVVYEQEEGSPRPDRGVIFLVGYGVDGGWVRVMSEYQGQVRCHSLDKSPSGKKPAYLLLKKHCPMKNVP
ncbi:MAG TPA: hypothetical protein VGB72_02640 [Acidobacteriota bacterium]